MNKRIKYIFLIIITIVLGLASRIFKENLPNWVVLYMGDILYGIMFYFIFSFIFVKIDSKKIMLLTIVYLVVIELSQLISNPFLDNLRNNTIGHLILGKGFLFSDVICYITGGVIGFGINKYIIDNK